MFIAQTAHLTYDSKGNSRKLARDQSPCRTPSGSLPCWHSFFITYYTKLRCHMHSTIYWFFYSHFIVITTKFTCSYHLLSRREIKTMLYYIRSFHPKNILCMLDLMLQYQASLRHVFQIHKNANLPNSHTHIHIVICTFTLFKASTHKRQTSFHKDESESFWSIVLIMLCHSKHHTDMPRCIFMRRARTTACSGGLICTWGNGCTGAGLRRCSTQPYADRNTEFL